MLVSFNKLLDKLINNNNTINFYQIIINFIDRKKHYQTLGQIK